MQDLHTDTVTYPDQEKSDKLLSDRKIIYKFCKDIV